MEEKLAWLRVTIELDKALAGKASPGNWEMVVDEHFPSCEDVSIWCEKSGDYITEEIKSGPRHHADGSHIARHDPRDTIARCEAELALLDRCERVIANPETYDETAEALAEEVIRRFAAGYRHRDGFKPEWVGE